MGQKRYKNAAERAKRNKLIQGVDPGSSPLVRSERGAERVQVSRCVGKVADQTAVSPRSHRVQVEPKQEGK